MNNYRPTDLSSADLKSLAKGQLFGNYGAVVGIYLIHLVCTLPLNFIISPFSRISPAFYYLAFLLVNTFTGLFLAGEALVYLKIACHEPPSVGDLFYYFHGPYAEKGSKVIRIQLIVSAISVVCTIPYEYVGRLLTRSMQSVDPSALSNGKLPFHPVLFLVYAVFLVAGCSIQVLVRILLSQIFYLMLDFPDYPASQLLHLAPKLIKGHKARFFYIMLSFVPLLLLGIFSCGIGYLWLYPYLQTTYANFYLNLMKKQGSVRASS